MNATQHAVCIVYAFLPAAEGCCTLLFLWLLPWLPLLLLFLLLAAMAAAAPAAAVTDKHGRGCHREELYEYVLGSTVIVVTNWCSKSVVSGLLP